MVLKGNRWIPVPHGRLEALYRPGPTPGAPVALVLHPHPLHGGTMHNKVVHRTAKALEEHGYATLRFNFRGVGQSTGQFDQGIGETADAEAALDFLLAEHPEREEVIVAGFSFGSVIGLRVGCADARVARIIAIGVPLRLDSLACLLTCTKPKLFLHGEADSIAPLAPTFLTTTARNCASSSGSSSSLVCRSPDENHVMSERNDRERRLAR